MNNEDKNPFSQMIGRGIRAGATFPPKTETARNWYRNAAPNISKVNNMRLMNEDPNRLSTRPLVGSMYLFLYDPKWKDELPYYDKFPLIFPFKKIKGGFYGLNLHYLPHEYRAALMDGFYSHITNTTYDESTKLKLNYELLKKTTNLKYYKPCFKHYLNDHVRSKFMFIYPSEWEMALHLPLERFEKASKRQVWKDSRRIIRG